MKKYLFFYFFSLSPLFTSKLFQFIFVSQGKTIHSRNKIRCIAAALLIFLQLNGKPPERRLFGKMIMDRIALIITIIGALNWGSIGLFGFDIVAWLGGGMDALVSRIIYTVVALAGIWCITLLFRTREKFSAIGEME